MKATRAKRPTYRQLRTGRRDRRPLTLMNFKISDADRKMFQRKANKTKNGNVSALILRAVKIAPLYKLRSL